MQLPDTHDPNFSLISPHPHYEPRSLRGMKEWGFGLPRVMDGFRGEYEVRCEMSLAHSSIFFFFLSTLGPNEDEERGI